MEYPYACLIDEEKSLARKRIDQEKGFTKDKTDEPRKNKNLPPKAENLFQ